MIADADFVRALRKAVAAEATRNFGGPVLLIETRRYSEQGHGHARPDHVAFAAKINTMITKRRGRP